MKTTTGRSQPIERRLCPVQALRTAPPPRQSTDLLYVDKLSVGVPKQLLRHGIQQPLHRGVGDGVISPVEILVRVLKPPNVVVAVGDDVHVQRALHALGAGVVLQATTRGAVFERKPSLSFCSIALSDASITGIEQNYSRSCAPPSFTPLVGSARNAAMPFTASLRCLLMISEAHLRTDRGGPREHARGHAQRHLHGGRVRFARLNSDLL